MRLSNFHFDYILDHREELKRSLLLRGIDIDLKLFFDLIEERKNLNLILNQIKERINRKQEEIEIICQTQGRQAITESIKQERKEIEIQLREKEEYFDNVYRKLEEIFLTLPNLLSPDVTKEDQILLRVEKERLNFTPLDHKTLGLNLGIVEVARTVRFSGSRNISYVGKGALVVNLLMQLMRENALKAGFEEVFLPSLVNREALIRSGHLPKFEEEIFKLEKDDLFLIPTSEVSLLNLFSTSTFQSSELPKKLFALTSCYRKEAGAYGKKYFGFTRLHQFRKLELFIFCKADESESCLDLLVKTGCNLLSQLGLQFQANLKSGIDTSFASRKTIDLEVYFDSARKYMEVSSCSDVGIFQTGRSEIFCTDESKRGTEEQKKRVLAHSLNGTGVAVDRLFGAILETHQNKEGRVILPKVLADRLGFKEI